MHFGEIHRALFIMSGSCFDALRNARSLLAVFADAATTTAIGRVYPRSDIWE